MGWYQRRVHGMVGQSAVSSMTRTEISMNTKYTVAAGMAKKKNPKTGDSKNLWGYQVRTRAPDMAKSSGTTKAEQSIFDKLFGKKDTISKDVKATGQRSTKRI